MNSFEVNINKLIPMRLPQYEIVQDDLMFMNFRKKKFSEKLVKTFLEINNIVNWETLIARGVSQEALNQLIDKNCVLLVQPEKQSVSPERVLILSPHVDDIAFSLGGYIEKYRDTKDFFIINVFGRQNYTLYWNHYESSRVKCYQEEEERFFCRAANIRQMQIWDYKDAPLREDYKDSDYINSGVSTKLIIQQEMELLRLIETDIDRIIRTFKPSYVLCPLGIGRHVDHILVRQACLNLKLPLEKIIFYEDMPYAISFEHKSNLEEIQDVYHCDLSRKSCDISMYIDKKRDFIKIYQSQLMRFQVNSIMKYNIKENEHRKKAFENLWNF